MSFNRSRPWRSPETLPDDFFNLDVAAPPSFGILTPYEQSLLTGRVPKPVYAVPAVYGLRLLSKGWYAPGSIASVSSLVKMAQGGRWHHMIFRGRTSAICWLNPRYTEKWPEFIDIARLTVEEVAALDAPLYPEDMTEALP